MTKKDYELIAKTIKTSKNFKDTEKMTKEDILRDLTASLCFKLQEDNPRFNADKFIKACGYIDHNPYIGDDDELSDLAPEGSQ